MKERPILFSAPMIRAIRKGQKTQTRRIVKPQPVVLPGWSTRFQTAREPQVDGVRFADRSPREATYAADALATYMDDIVRRFCPLGTVGDALWVRESFRPRYFDNGAPAFAADWTGESADLVPTPKWTPSIHMPRALSRIDLEVTAVRVERLQIITEEDARAEGVGPGSLSVFSSLHIGAFARLWDSINGERASWHSNPWVWVVGFRVVRGAL